MEQNWTKITYQIKYGKLTQTRDMILVWHMDIFVNKKILKIKKW